MQTIKWKIEKRKLSELNSLTNNPRKIKSINLSKLKEQISKRGFHDILKIDTDGTILSGNQRSIALQQLGYTEIDVSVPERKLTTEERQAVILESNIHSGEFDFEILETDFDQELLKQFGLLDINEVQTLTEIIEEITPFKKTHILLSFEPSKMVEIAEHLEKIKAIQGVEYEQASN
jgi:ParB-like chromosome segregation protein Spo0J